MSHHFASVIEEYIASIPNHNTRSAYKRHLRAIFRVLNDRDAVTDAELYLCAYHRATERQIQGLLEASGYRAVRPGLSVYRGIIQLLVRRWLLTLDEAENLITDRRASENTEWTTQMIAGDVTEAEQPSTNPYTDSSRHAGFRYSPASIQQESSRERKPRG